MKLPTVLLALLVSALPLAAETEDATLLRDLTANIEKLDAALTRDPSSTRLLSSRGTAHLFLGRFPEAVADYEKMIALDPSLDAGHWQLGIAYHFTEQWEKSSRQFAKYHAYDGRDRENGIWKFLADARLHDLATARKEMLAYTEFDREPFPALYDLLAGRLTSEQFQAHLESKKLADHPQVMFFAHYYRGLFEELTGEHEKALATLGQAVSLQRNAAEAGGGPGYMGQCARLHLHLLKKTTAAPK